MQYVTYIHVLGRRRIKKNGSFELCPFVGAFFVVGFFSPKPNQFKFKFLNFGNARCHFRLFQHGSHNKQCALHDIYVWADTWTFFLWFWTEMNGRKENEKEKQNLKNWTAQITPKTNYSENALNILLWIECCVCVCVWN